MHCQTLSGVKSRHLVQCLVSKPSEKTIGVWLSFCVCMHYKVLPSYHILRGFLLDLKNMV